MEYESGILCYLYTTHYYYYYYCCCCCYYYYNNYDDDDDDDDKVGFLLYAHKIKDLSQSLCEYQRRFTDDFKTSHNERLI